VRDGHAGSSRRATRASCASKLCRSLSRDLRLQIGLRWRPSCMGSGVAAYGQRAGTIGVRNKRRVCWPPPPPTCLAHDDSLAVLYDECPLGGRARTRVPALSAQGCVSSYPNPSPRRASVATSGLAATTNGCSWSSLVVSCPNQTILYNIHIHKPRFHKTKARGYHPLLPYWHSTSPLYCR